MTAADGIRQAAVVASALVAVAGSAVGSGAFGGVPIDEASGGALAADATVLAPAGPAFAIWSVIYAGLVAYAVWQALPGRREDARQRRIGWLAAASLVLNAAWILSVQFDLLALSVPVIAALLAVLLRIFVLLASTRPRGVVEAVLVDGAFGLYLGWVAIATVANVTALLVALGVGSPELNAPVGIAVLLLAAAAGVVLAVRGRGRLTPALALCWGVGWIAAGRLAGQPESLPVGVTAIVVALVVLAVTIALRVRHPGHPAA
ncbi:TspO/MBR family protein [Herbiconiux sp. SYSU D00978]|uniref:TspO/MBR family protein n=1 Tax=Herbiconiux sp. SYSU D00978 TaxID=2812562 RepID=UPI001A97136F|nr:TspO/MBR family protein [Herbiconiux sp. SYSU D00978]